MKLEPLPSRAHDFFSTPRSRVDVLVPGRSAPVGVSYVERGNGPPLLLVHGLMTSAYSWRSIIGPLSARFRVIAIDLPGAGESDAPGDLAQDPKTTASLLEAFCVALKLPPKIAVVGNSLGGYLCLWWALQNPERFEQLFVIHSPGFPELRLYALRFVTALPGARALFRFLTRDADSFIVKNQHYRDAKLHSVEGCTEYSRWVSDPARREVLFRTLREAMNPFAMREFHRRLAATVSRIPTRLLWSRQDVLVSPAFGRRYQRALGRECTELIWLEDSSHFTQVDSPEDTVREIVRWHG